MTTTSRPFDNVNVAGGSDVTVFCAKAVPARQTSAMAKAAKRMIGIVTHVKAGQKRPAGNRDMLHREVPRRASRSREKM